jgi:hypothetical protein
VGSDITLLEIRLLISQLEAGLRLPISAQAARALSRLAHLSGVESYFVTTGVVVSVPSFLARSPMALILVPDGTTNSTMRRLFAVTE